MLVKINTKGVYTAPGNLRILIQLNFIKKNYDYLKVMAVLDTGYAGDILIYENLLKDCTSQELLLENPIGNNHCKMNTAGGTFIDTTKQIFYLGFPTSSTNNNPVFIKTEGYLTDIVREGGTPVLIGLKFFKNFNAKLQFDFEQDIYNVFLNLEGVILKNEDI